MAQSQPGPRTPGPAHTTNQLCTKDPSLLRIPFTLTVTQAHCTHALLCTWKQAQTLRHLPKVTQHDRNMG